MSDELKAVLSRPTCSVEDFGKIFGLSRNSAYDAVKRGDVPSIRLGRLLRIPTAALKAKLGLEPQHEAAAA
jgi:hypothetical protein